MAEIRQTDEGNWQARVYLGLDRDGRKRRQTKTFKTYDKATKWAHAKETEKNWDRLVEPSKEKLSDYLDRYLDCMGLEGTRKRTVHNYRAIVRRWIHLDRRPGGRETKRKVVRSGTACPDLGSEPISKIRPDHIRALYAYMVNVHGLSGREVRHLHAILNPALRRAETEGLIGRNPAASVKPPKVVKQKVVVMKTHEVAAFLEASKEDRLAALWSLLLGTGLRPEEAYALAWSDIRDDEIHVQRVLVGKTSEGDWHYAPPKTENGTRVLPLFPVVDAALRLHRVRQAEEKLKAGPRYEDQGLVFATKTGTPLQHRNVVRRHYEPVMKAAGLLDAKGKTLYPPYVLRHVFATTALLKAKIEPKLVSLWLGHSSVSFTLDTYVQAGVEEMKEAAAVAQRKLFGT